VKKSNLPAPNIKELEKAFDGNLDLMLFYLTWIKNGLKTGKAYQELHPEVDEHSARTLGSRQLSKVDRAMVMQAYGLDQELYFNQLKQGNEAMKWNDFTGEREADHIVRAVYHDKLGKLLGIETSNESFGMEFKNGEKSIKIVVIF
jgi:hypothetical protein